MNDWDHFREQLFFRFTANRWLSEEKDDRKTFLDLSPDQQKTSSSTTVLNKGTE